MKKLLLLFFIALTSSAINAQLTCANATIIPTASATLVCPAITGTYPTGLTCFTSQATAPKAIWYKYTPASSGLITIDAGIAPNSALTNDTHLLLLSGTCAAITCVAENEDISTTDYRSRLSNISVTGGVTYYIVWDNNWVATGFSFQFTFTPATCFSPTGFTYTAAPTATTASIGWTAPTAGTPSGYQFEYGLRGFTQGAGTTLNPTTTSASMTSLSPSSVYSFYVRTFCGGSDYSVWSGPISFNTVFQPATPPYTTSLEDTNLGFLGWASSITGTGATATNDWFLYDGGTGSTLAQSGTISALAFSNGTTVSSGRMYSRGINLAANEVATITYYVRNYLGAGATGSASYKLTVGNAQTTAAQTTVLATETGISSIAFAPKSFTYTPTTAGVYYFSFLHNSPANTTSQALIVDTFAVSQVLSTSEFLTSKFSVSPNPANDFISVTNSDNILVSGISITDLNGRIVKQNSYTNVSDIQVNVSDLSSGMYMMNITSDKGSVTKKIVKN
ncbi:Secretion system C-terminal sorting domain [Flavobacteriaceae bacterium]